MLILRVAYAFGLKVLIAIYIYNNFIDGCEFILENQVQFMFVSDKNNSFDF